MASRLFFSRSTFFLASFWLKTCHGGARGPVPAEAAVIEGDDGFGDVFFGIALPFLFCVLFFCFPLGGLPPPLADLLALADKATNVTCCDCCIRYRLVCCWTKDAAWAEKAEVESKPRTSTVVKTAVAASERFLRVRGGWGCCEKYGMLLI